MFATLRDWFTRYRKYRNSLGEKAVVVEMDEDGISATYPNGDIASVNWKDVERIAIDTNASGPWGYDIWWALEGASESCVYPNGATGDKAALSEFYDRFDGFSDEAVIEAMGCTSNARFLCWERVHAP